MALVRAGRRTEQKRHSSLPLHPMRGSLTQDWAHAARGTGERADCGFVSPVLAPAPVVSVWLGLDYGWIRLWVSLWPAVGS